MSTHARNHGVVDEFHGIRSARVLGLAVVVVIGDARDRVEYHVFQHRTEVERVVDLRFGFRGQPNALGIAAAFEVENVGGAPAVLVIANQAAAGIGGERSVPRAGKSEEQRGNAIGADVGRAVHGKHVALGKHEVHHPKDDLLHFAGIFRTADERQLLAEVHQDEHFAVGAVAFRIGLKAGRAHDGEFGFVGLELVGGRANKELPQKKVVPGGFVDHLNGQTVFRIGAGKEVLYEKLLAFQIIEHTLIERVKLIEREWRS